MDRANVLVVDDNRDLAENIAEILATLGARVVLASSAEEALARAGEGPLDLALVDVRLPDLDGNELLARLRALSPVTPVVLITGDATIESAVSAVRHGAFSYLLKPFAPQDLLETAQRALDQVAIYRERERLRGELERSERRHRLVVEAVPAFVLALDPQGRIALWNRRLEEATGRSREEMVGRPGAALIGAGGVRPLPPNPQAEAGEERLVRWERAEVDVAEQGGRWTYAVGSDVTTEQEMLRRTLRAERLAAVGTMAAGLAHEVRNPLNSASLQLTLLKRRLGKEDVAPASLLPIADLVQQEIERLDRLVRDFLAFAQPRPLALQATALEALCRGVLALLEPEAEAARVRFATELAPELPTLPVDPERLKQVLLNLVRNAIEAMSDGGTLTMRTRAAGEHVELEVEDTGPGFGEETPVFDAFFTTKPQGTGLGLAIVHRIVSDHGGTLRVRSRPGSTCFTVSLPVERPTGHDGRG
jgi:signal transduction histidine kinase